MNAVCWENLLLVYTHYITFNPFQICSHSFLPTLCLNIRHTVALQHILELQACDFQLYIEGRCVTMLCKEGYASHESENILVSLCKLSRLDSVEPAWVFEMLWVVHWDVKGTRQLFFFLLSASLPSSRQEDRSHSFDCACNNKEETGRAHPWLISLAQTLVVNGKC